ncbi:PREDICTED: putative UPF0481 protein At3g02645 [Nelumbo nucifera]|uniref:UPF0481 protein At3g02645 n=2 Tax=Nelumbo nucifera TaxID=4432 RepID=A0A1U7ZA70_NELNU|nr:PREDICTED: putative UPF0481 protein At3g02645 [Nelumbo nucifera]DAD45098.1 TPA_asm: hypothetical protein HUJ06_003328 [Nelumbo nucifera]
MAHNAILRDITMLENQIPMFALRKILGFQCSSPDVADDLLSFILMGLCKELSPLKTENFSLLQVSQHAHLLDLLYRVIVPNSDEPQEVLDCEENEQNEETKVEEGSDSSSSNIKQLLSEIWKLISAFNIGMVRLLEKILLLRPIKLIFALPWKMIPNLPGISIIKEPIDKFFVSHQDKETIKPDNESLRSQKIEKHPLVEEIMIPSVSELHNSGVNFCKTNGNITTVGFDEKTTSLYLPTISLDVNTEVMMRNLVAYEASSASGPLVFTRYTELMNGIIDTVEDVKLLREKGIIVNRLKSDREVAKLWNGMSKSIRLTRVLFLDKTIEDVNKYYNGRWKVKASKFMKKYVFGSWKLLTLVATILLLLLTTLQAFCSVYSCARAFHVNYVA